MAPPHTDLPIRVLACDELGYVRAFATDPAAGGDAAEDLTLIGKFGALDRARRAVRARAVCELRGASDASGPRVVCARKGIRRRGGGYLWKARWRRIACFCFSQQWEGYYYAVVIG